ncbi:MAG: hypothetical protein ACOCQY_02955 [Halorhabdus sp.]
MHTDAQITLTGASTISLVLLAIGLHYHHFVTALTAAGLFASAFAVAVLFDRSVTAS